MTNTVLSVDCFRPAPTRKVLEAIEAQHGILEGDVSTTDGTEGQDLGRFVHYRCLTLPHLLALILRPSSAAIPANVSVVVLDSLTALVNAALPKPIDGRAKEKAFKGKVRAERKALLGVTNVRSSRTDAGCEKTPGTTGHHDSPAKARRGPKLRGRFTLAVCH